MSLFSVVSLKTLFGRFRKRLLWLMCANFERSIAIWCLTCSRSRGYLTSRWCSQGRMDIRSSRRQAGLLSRSERNCSSFGSRARTRFSSSMEAPWLLVNWPDTTISWSPFSPRNMSLRISQISPTGKPAFTLAFMAVLYRWCTASTSSRPGKSRSPLENN